MRFQYTDLKSGPAATTGSKKLLCPQGWNCHTSDAMTYERVDRCFSYHTGALR